MIVFIILNYKNLEETEKCIKSIFELDDDSVEAIIVDNGSRDGSVKRMHELYDCNDKIHIIESETNLGFSKGNNLGYTYIKDNMKPDFVVVTNNDVLFPQKDMTRLIDSIYQQTKFHVLGPDIFVRANKEHQSPIRLSLPSKQDIASDLKMYEYYLSHPEKWARRKKMQTLKNRVTQSNRLLKQMYDTIRGKDKINYTRKYENCCVQGACIIISKDYLRSEEKMFTPEPFLYCEEIMLQKKCLEKGYKIVYDPAIQIWHEDSSTMKKMNKDSVERAKFTLRNHVEARKMLLKLF